jgi:hypothetical protein
MPSRNAAAGEAATSTEASRPDSRSTSTSISIGKPKKAAAQIDAGSRNDGASAGRTPRSPKITAWNASG